MLVPSPARQSNRTQGHLQANLPTLSPKHHSRPWPDVLGIGRLASSLMGQHATTQWARAAGGLLSMAYCLKLPGVDAAAADLKTALHSWQPHWEFVEVADILLWWQSGLCVDPFRSRLVA